MPLSPEEELLHEIEREWLQAQHEIRLRRALIVFSLLTIFLLVWWT